MPSSATLQSAENRIRAEDAFLILHPGRKASGCLLGIGFLQQGAPELVVGGRVKHDEVVSHRGQAIVDNNVQPLIVLPKLRRKTEEFGTC